MEEKNSNPEGMTKAWINGLSYGERVAFKENNSEQYAAVMNEKINPTLEEFNSMSYWDRLSLKQDNEVKYNELINQTGGNK